MCQLFGISTAQPAPLNDLLREFFCHAEENPHGWGFADLSNRDPLILRSPRRADQCDAAASLLSRPLTVSCALAHIRYATVGQVEQANCHPFSGIDASGRKWTLIHKGTIFSYEPLNSYFYKQAGSTDSERILLYLIDAIDARLSLKGAPLEADERFAIFDEVTAALAPGNCLNLLVYDSDRLYLYSNFAGGLSLLRRRDGMVFCTSHLVSAGPWAISGWQPVPLCVAQSYRKGALVDEGPVRHDVYQQNPEDTRYLYQDFAGL